MLFAIVHGLTKSFKGLQAMTVLTVLMAPLNVSRLLSVGELQF